MLMMTLDFLPEIYPLNPSSSLYYQSSQKEYTPAQWNNYIHMSMYIVVNYYFTHEDVHRHVAAVGGKQILDLVTYIRRLSKSF